MRLMGSASFTGRCVMTSSKSSFRRFRAVCVARYVVVCGVADVVMFWLVFLLFLSGRLTPLSPLI